MSRTAMRVNTKPVDQSMTVRKAKSNALLFECLMETKVRLRVVIIKNQECSQLASRFTFSS
jgi:hypothetical protein